MSASTAVVGQIAADRVINREWLRIAADVLNHLENGCKSPEFQDGKTMVVGMSHNICTDLYDKIIKLRPEWHSDNHGKGAIKMVFCSSALDNEKLRPRA